jgi:hypothetical protein
LIPKRPQRFLDEKLPELERLAEAAGEPGVLDPIREVWDRDLRNAVFHADYSIHGSKTRIPGKGKSYSHDETQTLVNRALAYHGALAVIQEFTSSHTPSQLRWRCTRRPQAMRTRRWS